MIDATEIAFPALASHQDEIGPCPGCGARGAWEYAGLDAWEAHVLTCRACGAEPGEGVPRD